MKLFRALLTAAYPLLVYAGLQVLEPRWIAIGLGAVIGLRAVTRWRRPSADELRELAMPALLIAFGRTLLGAGPPLVETFARLQFDDLPPEEVAYCRSVTLLWCGFFVANGSVALWLALSGDTAAWALYNGLVAYLLMGLLFAAEFTVRSWRFGRYGGTLVEPLFRRLFPRGPTT